MKQISLKLDDKTLDILAYLQIALKDMSLSTYDGLPSKSHIIRKAITLLYNNIKDNV